MKKPRLIPLFVSAALISTLSLNALSPVSAQPAPGTAKTGKKGKGAKRGAGLPKRMVAKFEEKLGKPLTEDQKSRLATAHKARLAANKANQEKFNQEAATVTGLSLEDIKNLNKRGNPATGAMAPR